MDAIAIDAPVGPTLGRTGDLNDGHAVFGQERVLQGGFMSDAVRSINDALDAALAMTFPASDPVAVFMNDDHAWDVAIANGAQPPADNRPVHRSRPPVVSSSVPGQRVM